MLKIGTICAALILATAAISTPAEAFKGGSKGMGFGGHKGMSVGAYSRGTMAAVPHATRGMYRSSTLPSRNLAWQGGKQYWQGDRHHHRNRYRYYGGYGGYYYGDYWPYAAAGALAFAAAGPYYYGYDDCYRTQRVWTPYGWRWQPVYVCDYHYPY